MYINNLTSESEIKDQDTILLIDEYKKEYLPYIRRCRGLISHVDKLKNYELTEVVQNYHISYMCDIFNILSDYYMINKDEEFYLDLIQYLRDNKKLNVWK